MGNCFSGQNQNINKIALQSAQKVIQQYSSKNMQLLIVGPELSGRKTFNNIFQPDEQQVQFLGSKQFETLKQQNIKISTYQMDGLLQSFQNIDCVIFTISSEQIEKYNTFVKQSIMSALQQQQIQKVLVIVSHIDKCYILTKDVIMNDIKDIDNKDKLYIIESNLLIMEKVIEGVEWIFEELSSN